MFDFSSDDTRANRDVNGQFGEYPRNPGEWSSGSAAT